MEANLSIDVGKLSRNIVVDILDKDENFISDTTAIIIPTSDDQLNDAVFEYSFWADPGRRLTFVPRDPRYADSLNNLFWLSFTANSWNYPEAFGCPNP